MMKIFRKVLEPATREVVGHSGPRQVGWGGPAQLLIKITSVGDLADEVVARNRYPESTVVVFPAIVAQQEEVIRRFLASLGAHGRMEDDNVVDLGMARFSGSGNTRKRQDRAVTDRPQMSIRDLDIRADATAGARTDLRRL